MKNDISKALKIKIFIGIMLFIALMTLFVFEFHWFSNTIEANRLITYSIVIGILFCGVISYFLLKNVEDFLDRIRTSLLILFIGITITPLLASITNRLATSNPIEYQTFVFVEEKPKGGFYVLSNKKQAPEAYFLFVMKNGAMHRFRSSKPNFVTTERGEEISLPVKKGLFGFEVVCLE